MTAAYQQALHLLPSLTADERKNLRVALGQFNGSAKSVVATSSVDDWLFEGVLKELSRRGLVYRVKDAADVQRIAPNYEDDAAFVRSTLEKSLKQGMPDFRRIHLSALGCASARCLANYITSWRLQSPLGLKFMLTNTSKTFEAIDKSFPGYLQSGMVSVLVQRALPNQD
jgi:hypothetical protein